MITIENAHAITGTRVRDLDTGEVGVVTRTCWTHPIGGGESRLLDVHVEFPGGRCAWTDLYGTHEQYQFFDLEEWDT